MNKIEGLYWSRRGLLLILLTSLLFTEIPRSYGDESLGGSQAAADYFATQAERWGQPVTSFIGNQQATAVKRWADFQNRALPKHAFQLQLSLTIDPQRSARSQLNPPKGLQLSYPLFPTTLALTEKVRSGDHLSLKAAVEKISLEKLLADPLFQLQVYALSEVLLRQASKELASVIARREVSFSLYIQWPEVSEDQQGNSALVEEIELSPWSLRSGSKAPVYYLCRKALEPAPLENL